MDIWERKEGVYSTSEYVPERPECRDTKMTYTTCPIARESQEEDDVCPRNEERNQTPQDLLWGRRRLWDCATTPRHTMVFKRVEAIGFLAECGGAVVSRRTACSVRVSSVWDISLHSKTRCIRCGILRSRWYILLCLYLVLGDGFVCFETWSQVFQTGLKVAM